MNDETKDQDLKEFIKGLPEDEQEKAVRYIVVMTLNKVYSEYIEKTHGELPDEAFLNELVDMSVKEIMDSERPFTEEEYERFVFSLRERSIDLPVPYKTRRELKRDKIFAMPSHDIMLTLLAIFAGKTGRIPRKLLSKPYRDRTPEEKQDADEFMTSVLQGQKREFYDDAGKKQVETIAVVSDNKKVEAEARIIGTLFDENLEFREEKLAMYIKKAFGPQGMRHLLGIIIGLYENGMKGTFEWTLNEHLERLGHQKKISGSYKQEVREAASAIIKIFTSLFITASRKDKKDRIIIQGERLLSIDGFRVETFQNTIIDERLRLRATDFWYRNAIDPESGYSPQYTVLLKKIAATNHRDHPLTLYLGPLLAVFWRISKSERRLSVKSLMDWCDLDYSLKNRHRMRDLRNLEGELQYMVEKEHLGEWYCDGEKKRPSECKRSFDCHLTFEPPIWLEPELKRFREKRESLLTRDGKKKRLGSGKPKLEIPTGQRTGILTRDEFKTIFKRSGLTQNQFGNNIGVVRNMVSLILKGERNISEKLSAKTRRLFGHLLDE